VDWRSVEAVVRLLWRAAAAGLKPLRLPRAPQQTTFAAETGTETEIGTEIDARPRLRMKVAFRQKCQTLLRICHALLPRPNQIGRTCKPLAIVVASHHGVSDFEFAF